MTNQEMFDTALEGLRKQGKPAMDSYGHCVFRAPDGSKCAVGMLIPDEEYQAKMEIMSLDSVTRKCSNMGLSDGEFLIDLQNKMHDNPAQKGDFVSEMELGAQEVARNWNLKYEKP